MLASFVLEAKLMGSAVVGIDATAVGSGSFALAGALAERLLEVVPMAAAEAVEVAGVLGHVSPAVHRALGEPALVVLKPFEHARKLSAAVVALVEAACRLQPLMIAVDDVHRADGASLGALGPIAALAEQYNLLLVTTCDESALRDAPPVLAELVAIRHRIELAALRAEETRELLGSLFGAVSGLDEAAAWLHELSLGSPQTCMQYAQYLVDHGIADYEGGHWRLPANLRDQALPATLGTMLEGRLSALSEDARALALGLALARDETRSIWQPESHIRIEDYPKLLGSSAVAPAAGHSSRVTSEAARAFAALDELLRAGMVQQRDSSYVLGQRAMVDALLRISDGDLQNRMHERLALVLDQPEYQGRLLPVRQLQRAGQHARARAMIVGFADHLGGAGAMNWGAMRVSLTAEVTRNAFAQWRADGGSVREGTILRRMLLMTSAVYDWSMARFGDEQVAQLRADCGLAHYDQTDPALTPLERVVECLKRAQERYEQAPEAGRGLPPGDAVRELASCVMTLLGAYVNAHDVARTRTLPGVLAPLRPLSPLIELMCELCELGVDRVVGRELGERIATLGVDRLFQQTALPEVLRQGGAAINIYTQAVEDARRGRTRGLELIELIAAGAGEEMFLVVHARWLGHAFHGQSELAQRFRKRAELITEDDVWRRKAALFVEAELHALTGDLLQLGRTCEAIATLVDAFPGWQPWLHWSRAMMYQLRGEYEAAEVELQAALARARPGAHRAWLRIGPSLCELRLLCGDADGAVREAEAALDAVRALSLDRTAAVAAERVRALAESSRHNHEGAAAALERMFVLARVESYDGLPLARLHEAHARVALAGGRIDECATALASLHDLLVHADAPALIHAYETMRAEIRQIATPELPTVTIAPRSMQTELSDIATQVLVRMGALNERQERAQQALQLLLEDSGADLGHLFLFDAGGLFAAASVNDTQPAPELIAIAQRHIDSELGKASTEALTVAVDIEMAATTAPTLMTTGISQLSPVLLSAGADAGMALTGLALLGTRAAVLRTPRTDLVRAISRCLLAAGDSVPLVIED
jgi:tetratricopeptide (TPR) repeat protein